MFSWLYDQRQGLIYLNLVVSMFSLRHTTCWGWRCCKGRIIVRLSSSLRRWACSLRIYVIANDSIKWSKKPLKIPEPCNSSSSSMKIKWLRLTEWRTPSHDAVHMLLDFSKKKTSAMQTSRNRVDSTLLTTGSILITKFLLSCSAAEAIQYKSCDAL